jgi:hypothetical protein
MNRRAIRYLTVGSVAVGLGIAGTLVAYAQWSIPGQAALQITTTAMPAGETPTAKRQPAAVVVTWPAQQIAPGVNMQSYVVTAHDTATSPRPDIARTVAAGTETATFTLAELGSGTWSWGIAPKFHLWSGAEGPRSAPPITVAAAPPSALLAVAAPAKIPTSAPATGKPAPPAATVATDPAPATTPTPEATSAKPKADPTTSAPGNPEKVEKTVEPEKTGTAKPEPTHSGTPSEGESAPAP